MGKDGCLKIDAQTTPSVSMDVISTKLWSCDSMQVLGSNKPKYVGARVPFFPYAMNALHFFPKITQIAIHYTLNFGLVHSICHLAWIQFVSPTSYDLDGIPLVMDAMSTIDLDWKDDGSTTCCEESKGITTQWWGTKKLSLSLWCI